MESDAMNTSSDNTVESLSRVAIINRYSTLFHRSFVEEKLRLYLSACEKDPSSLHVDEFSPVTFEKVYLNYGPDEANSANANDPAQGVVTSGKSKTGDPIPPLFGEGKFAQGIVTRQDFDPLPNFAKGKCKVSQGFVSGAPAVDVPSVVFSPDFALGKENLPIPIVGETSTAPRFPPDSKFRYLKSNVILLDGKLVSGNCLECYEQCSLVIHCRCLRYTTLKQVAYDGGGQLTSNFLRSVLAAREGQADTPFIKELVQKGLTLPFEVFSTSSGFCLRTVDFIPRATFLFEYTGEVVTLEEVVDRLGQGKSAREFIVELDKGKFAQALSKRLCIDASTFGNLARFLLRGNSMSANVVAIPVLMESKQQRYYHVSIFSLIDLQPRTILVWDLPEASLLGFDTSRPKNVKVHSSKYIEMEAKEGIKSTKGNLKGQKGNNKASGSSPKPSPKKRCRPGR